MPARSLIREYRASAEELGISPMAWQLIAARYATGQIGKRLVFREFAAVVARQNGKTKFLLPLIWMRLKAGRRILHTAQNRAIPRETFLELARLVNGREEVAEIRFANGQEVIRMTNGGRYTLVAPRPGVRGFAVDDVLLDEVREQRSFDLVAAIRPTMTASRDPQIVYLSNAGDEDSVVLNDLRRRMHGDETLAYLEWSSSPERSLDDREGWAEANPALGITIREDTLEGFRASFPPNVFETEHLCRWVISMLPRLVDEAAWDRARIVDAGKPLRPVMGVNMDPSGSRLSAVIAWKRSDGSIGLRVEADRTGDPVDVTTIAPLLVQRAAKLGAVVVLFDDWTDKMLASYFRKPTAVMGREFANASETFVRLVDSGLVRWDLADEVSADLSWTARKPYENGAWQAVRAKDDRPVTAVLAAIRAVWRVATTHTTAPRVY